MVNIITMVLTFFMFCYMAFEHGAIELRISIEPQAVIVFVVIISVVVCYICV